jgi:hypothetical protein
MLKQQRQMRFRYGANLMFDYRLFFASSTLDGDSRDRRPILGHDEKRVYRLPVERRPSRSKDRR